MDHHHGFTVEYGPNKDKNLKLHVDDSEITLNHCIGTTFKGGNLRFYGIRCKEHINSDFGKFKN